MSEVVLSELDRCLGKRGGLQLHLGPSPPSPPSPKRPCTMAACARVANPGLVRDASPPTADPDDGHTSATTASTSNSSEWDDATSWDTNLVPDMALGRTRPLDKDDARGQYVAAYPASCMAWAAAQTPRDCRTRLTSSPRRTIEESCKRALDHFPCPTIAFPTPTLEFDFRVAVTLKPESSQVQGRAHKEITAISSGNWSGSFGHGKVMVRLLHPLFPSFRLALPFPSVANVSRYSQAGGYDLGQARGFRPIRIVEGAFIMQTTDEAPAT